MYLALKDSICVFKSVKRVDWSVNSLLIVAVLVDNSPLEVSNNDIYFSNTSKRRRSIWENKKKGSDSKLEDDLEKYINDRNYHYKHMKKNKLPYLPYSEDKDWNF